MQNMKISDQGKVQLVCLEGISQRKYKDTQGVWTIGIGATSTEFPDLAQWPLDKELSLQECFTFFDVHLQRYENELNTYLTKLVPQYVFDALVSWCYNVGIEWVQHATVIRDINAGVTGELLYHDLMMYDKPPEIIGRRRKEAILISQGEYLNNGRAELIGTNKQIKVADYLGVRVQETSAPTLWQTVKKILFWK